MLKEHNPKKISRHTHKQKIFLKIQKRENTKNMNEKDQLKRKGKRSTETQAEKRTR